MGSPSLADRSPPRGERKHGPPQLAVHEHHPEEFTPTVLLTEPTSPIIPSLPVEPASFGCATTPGSRRAHPHEHGDYHEGAEQQPRVGVRPPQEARGEEEISSGSLTQNSLYWPSAKRTSTATYCSSPP